ncbi:putative Demethylmenaquinone methyltransferase [Bisporella sp. PMI_857]|nr:putative Demethylmenaquinone methyltransferase [Bisporella sp. PMI_857]
MAEEQLLPGRTRSTSVTFPARVPYIPSEFGYSPQEDEILEDTNESSWCRHKHPTSRTIYHQRRGDDDTLNSIRSLYDSDVVYIDIHGRRYCKEYYMPIDELEQARLLMLSSVFYEIIDHRYTTIDLSNPTKILDIGTGTGEWAMEMAEEYPNAEIIGTDVAKIQPDATPLNVFFEIDDAEEEGGWTFPLDSFDLIHLRYMKGAFKDWKYVYNQAYEHLKPGGWIEVLDFDDHKQTLEYLSEHETRFMKEVQEGSRMAGRPRSIEHLAPSYLTDLGFTDVKCSIYAIPVGVWPDEEEVRRVGKHFLIAVVNGIESLCLRVLSEQRGWDIEEIQYTVEKVGQTMWDIATDPERSKGMTFEIRVLVGRKPFEGEDVGSARTTMMAMDERSL